MLTLWIEILRRRFPVKLHMFAKNRASGSSRLFAVHNSAFREGRTDVRTYGRTNERTNTDPTP